MNLSVVMAFWYLSPRWQTVDQLLEGVLWTLSNQSCLPAEILLVDAGMDKDLSDRVCEACGWYPRIRVVHAPQEVPNVSRAFNVGIRETDDRSEFVMVTNPEFLFSPTVVENLMGMARHDRYIHLPIGSLPERVRIGNPWTVWDRWKQLVHQAKRPTESETGVLSCVSRDWLHRVRGYDEIGHPYNNNDSDLARRAHLSGMEAVHIPWKTCQTLHRGHPRPPEYWSVASPMPTEDEQTIVRNPAGWGEHV